MRKKANRFEGVKEFSNETNAIKRVKTKTFVKEDCSDYRGFQRSMFTKIIVCIHNKD